MYVNIQNLASNALILYCYFPSFPHVQTIYRLLLEAQKNRTHVDPEVTLQFLKSAIYYFLTDKENSQGHLQAIESILEFTEAEKTNINKARTAK